MSTEIAPRQPSSARVAAFLKRASNLPRLAFVIDATASRQPSWDMAAKLTAELFAEAAKAGGIEISITYFRDTPGECKSSPWTTSAIELTRLMSSVFCQAGKTQIEKALNHVKKEHEQKPIACAVFIGDACEEEPEALYRIASELGFPLLLFQEGDNSDVATIFSTMARLSKGAHCKFAPGAAQQLAELLRAVVAFAAGGIKALRSQNTEAARKLLGQMKPKS